jgi:hypothetical protein
MKKLLLILLAMSASYCAFAEHIFKVCYVNQSDASVPYINSGISRKWKSRGELVGNGDLKPGEKKCFGNIKDETVFSTDMITFTLDHKWFGIMNPGFAHPYVISQDATEKKGGKLTDTTDDGRDNYSLYMFIMKDGSVVLSTSSDLKDEGSIIKPRKFST